MNDRMDFDCNIDARKEIVITLPRDADDPEQNVLILVVTNEGVVFDFYTDGELVTTMARTYEEWRDEGFSVDTSIQNHPTQKNVDVWKAFQSNTLKS